MSTNPETLRKRRSKDNETPDQHRARLSHERLNKRQRRAKAARNSNNQETPETARNRRQETQEQNLDNMDVDNMNVDNMDVEYMDVDNMDVDNLTIPLTPVIDISEEEHRVLGKFRAKMDNIQYK